MKRVTLLADRIESEGTTHRIYLACESKGCLYIHRRHVLSVEDADARDFAPPAPPAAGGVLTTAELDALPPGSVVDATVTGTRVRAMLSETREWHMSAYLDGSRVALSRELTDAVLVTDGPITPAPIKPLPLPTEPGARFWGRVNDSEPTWWFVRWTGEPGSVWYLPPKGYGVFPREVDSLGLVRLPDPDTSDVTA